MYCLHQLNDKRLVRGPGFKESLIAQDRSDHEYGSTNVDVMLDQDL